MYTLNNPMNKNSYNVLRTRESIAVSTRLYQILEVKIETDSHYRIRKIDTDKSTNCLVGERYKDLDKCKRVFNWLTKPIN